MADIEKINRFLQREMDRRGLDFITPKDAGKWLDERGLLRDSETRQGLPLRNLLREHKIVGQRQERNGRWFIDRVGDLTGSQGGKEKSVPHGQSGLAGDNEQAPAPFSESMYSAILQPKTVWSRAQVLSSPCPVPSTAGVYAWYFNTLPPGVPSDDCIVMNGLTLLYVGISPQKPSESGGLASSSTLRNRIRNHYRGNASGSTLRLSLGCLLSEDLGIELRRVGSSERLTFASGEDKLSDWMAEHAFVTWLEFEKPWDIEHELIAGLSLPLNIEGNSRHPFYPILSKLRRLAKERARALPVAR